MKKFIKNNIILIGSILIFLAFKLSYVSKFQLIGWDESVYIGMGKYMFSFGKIGLWEIIRPMGLPFFLGFFWKLGMDLSNFGSYIMILFSIGTIIMTYILGKLYFDKKNAIIACIILMCTPLYFFESSSILTGIPSTLFALFSLYFFKIKKYGLSGLFSAITFMFRFPQGIIFLGVGFTILLRFHKKIFSKELSKFIINFLYVLIPFIIFNLIVYGHPLKSVLEASLHQSNIVHSIIGGKITSIFLNLTYYIVELIKQNYIYGFFFVGVFYFINSKKNKKNKNISILVLIILFFTYFTYIINKQPRFLLVILPYISLFTAYGITKSLKYLKYNYLKILIGLLLILLIIPSLSNISKIYVWRTGEIPPIFEFYNYFENKTTDTKILTMSPMQIAYSDIYMVPMYDNVDEAIRIYNENNKHFNIIIYTSNFYPCYNEECDKKKNLLFNDILKNNQIIFHIETDQDYYIFKKNSSV